MWHLCRRAVAVGLSYDVADLPIGLHEAVVTVSSPEAFNGPQTLAVSVDVRSVRPDLDWDGDVDLDDFALLQACLTVLMCPRMILSVRGRSWTTTATWTSMTSAACACALPGPTSR
jgi:hypothetical protein